MTSIAIIGPGFIADYHVDGIRAAATGEVTTLVGRDPARTAARAAELGVANAATDDEAVLADPAIDAVVIATPDFTHKPMALAALAAGKHVLLQKPMAMTAAECREIMSAAADSSATLTVSFMHRYLSESLWLRERLAERTYGQIQGVRLRNATPGAAWSDWFLDPARCAGGVVMQLGVHGIDLLQHLFGPISDVSARMTTMRPEVPFGGVTRTMPFEDNVAAVYGMEAGFAVSHEMCWTEVAGTDRFRMEVTFERATVRLRTEEGLAVVVTADGHEVVDIGDAPLGQAHHANWLEIVRGEAPADDTALAGLSTLLVGEAIYRSARDGRSIAVPR